MLATCGKSVLRLDFGQRFFFAPSPVGTQAVYSRKPAIAEQDGGAMIASAPFQEVLSSALTPITLISGVGMLILCMTNRYSHCMDRIRGGEDSHAGPQGASRRARHRPRDSSYLSTGALVALFNARHHALERMLRAAWRRTSSAPTSASTRLLLPPSGLCWRFCSSLPPPSPSPSRSGFRSMRSALPSNTCPEATLSKSASRRHRNDVLQRASRFRARPHHAHLGRRPSDAIHERPLQPRDEQDSALDERAARSEAHRRRTRGHRR